MTTDTHRRQEGGSHYTDMPLQPWDVVDTWEPEQRVGFYRGNALKYVMRAGAKERTLDEFRTDVAKALHYLQKLQEVLRAL